MDGILGEPAALPTRQGPDPFLRQCRDSTAREDGPSNGIRSNAGYNSCAMDSAGMTGIDGAPNRQGSQDGGRMDREGTKDQQ